MDNKSNPELMEYRLDKMDKCLERIENAMGNYALKSELASTKASMDQKVSELKKELHDYSKKRSWTVIVAYVVAVIGMLVSAISLYELFRG